MALNSPQMAAEGLKSKPQLRRVFINLIQRQLPRVVGIQPLEEHIDVTRITGLFLKL